MRKDHTRIMLNENPYLGQSIPKGKTKRISLYKSLSQDRTYYRKNDLEDLHPIKKLNYTRFENHSKANADKWKEKNEDYKNSEGQIIKFKGLISNLSRNENNKLKEKVLHLSHYSIINKNPIYGLEKPLISDNDFNEIQHRINHMDPPTKIIPLIERKFIEIALLKGIEKVYSINILNKISPINIKFKNAQLNIISLFASYYSKNPNIDNCIDKICPINSSEIYHLNLGFSPSTKYNFNILYLSFIGIKEISFSLIFSFGKEYLFEKIDYSKLNNRDLIQYRSNNKINNKTNDPNNSINQLMEIINEKAQLIKKMRRERLLFNSKNRDIVKANKLATIAYIDFLKERYIFKKKNETRMKMAKSRSNEIMKWKLIHKTIDINKKEIQKRRDKIIMQFIDSKSQNKNFQKTFILIFKFRSIIEGVKLKFQNYKQLLIKRFKLTVKLSLLYLNIRKIFRLSGKDIKVRTQIKIKLCFLMQFNYFNFNEKCRNKSIFINFHQSLLPTLIAKEITFSFINAIFKIQKLCRDIIICRVTQQNLIIELWKIRVAELYSSTKGKGKKSLINVKNLMNISEQQRNNAISEFFTEERKEYNTKLKAWRSKLKQIENELNKNPEINSDQQQNNLQSNLEQHLKQKPIFVYIPSMKKLNNMILKASKTN